MGLLRDLRPAAADLFAGSQCVGCADPGRPLCQPCGRRLRDPPFRAEPSPRPRRLPAVWAAAPYDGVVRAALLAHKEHATLALTPVLGRLLARSIVWCLAAAEAGGYDADRALVVPVPSRASAVRARGHDPVLRMSRVAAVAARAAGLDVAVAPMLRLRRHVRDQASLDRAQRRANLSGAMEVRRRRPRESGLVVVVDDIVTTGATADECARVLRDAGRRVVGVAVVAATPRRIPDG